jgi:hypothetical protein
MGASPRGNATPERHTRAITLRHQNRSAALSPCVSYNLRDHALPYGIGMMPLDAGYALMYTLLQAGKSRAFRQLQFSSSI